MGARTKPENDHATTPVKGVAVESPAMPHAKKEPPIFLELRLVEAATPERVEAAARMFRRMLDAVHPGLPPDSVTMVVTNRSMGAALRPWSKEALAAAKAVAAFARAPVGYLKKHPQQLELVDVVSSFVREANSESGALLKGAGAKRTAVVIDSRFAQKLEAHRSKVEGRRAQTPLVVSTSTSVRSVVLRVGKVAEGKVVCARINLEGEPREIPIEGDPKPFFAAAQDEGIHRIRLRIAWKHDRDGVRRVDTDKCALMALTKLAPALRGQALVDALIDATPTLQGMTDEEIESRLAAIRGG